MPQRLPTSLGAQTTATASSSIVWYPDCVCTSTELRKHDWEGCVWTQPRGNNPLWSCASKISSSARAETVSEVPSCFGMMSVQMEKVAVVEEEEKESSPPPPPPTSLPARMPQNSTFLEVAAEAARRKSSRSAAGMWTSLRPFRARGGAPGADAVAGGGGRGGGAG